jgi:RNA-dependent RNA polymerase
MSLLQYLLYLLQHGTKDEACIRLAKLCSQAVDYPKNGIPVDLQTDPLPSTLIRPKPDWQSAEVEMPRGTDFYESSRALGELFRAITLADTAEISTDDAIVDPSRDPISIALEPRVKHQVFSDLEIQEADNALFLNYTDELKYICVTHTLTNQPDVRLLEEEVVIGTILAKCSQKRWRSDRIYRMQLHTSVLVQKIHGELLKNPENASMNDLQRGLALAWRAWNISVRRKPEFGSSSYGLIALDVMFNCLDRLGELGRTVSNHPSIPCSSSLCRYRNSYRSCGDPAVGINCWE